MACRRPDGFHLSDDKTWAQGAKGDWGLGGGKRVPSRQPPLAHPLGFSLHGFESEMFLSS